MQQWMLQQHHSSHEFTICQVIMSTKSVPDHIFPLFIGVDQSPEGDVVIICDIRIKKKQKLFSLTSVSTLPLYYLAPLCGKLLLWR